MSLYICQLMPPDESWIAGILKLKFRTVTQNSLPVNWFWTFSMLNDIAKLRVPRSEFTEIEYLIFYRGGVLTPLLSFSAKSLLSDQGRHNGQILTFRVFPSLFLLPRLVAVEQFCHLLLSLMPLMCKFPRTWDPMTLKDCKQKRIIQSPWTKLFPLLNQLPW